MAPTKVVPIPRRSAFSRADSKIRRLAYWTAMESVSES